MSDHEAGPTSSAEKPTIGHLIERLSEQVIRLARAEIALAKAELAGKGKQMAGGLGALAAAATFAFFLVPVLLFMVAGYLAPHFGWGTALLIVLVGTLLLIVVPLGVIGVTLLKRSQPLKPEKAVENVTQDVATIREGLRP